MPRANRYPVANQVWHITHRCHKRAFLLKFLRDRKRWRYWLFVAKRRYGLCVLNYVVTCNHIHLLVCDRGQGEIARSMQLVAGRTAQEYNQRKQRKGAFWEDRYHATAVDSNEYLARCMTYIDLNMVRAGVVGHPEQWLSGGHVEIQNIPSRYRVIDYHRLQELLSLTSQDAVQAACRNWVAQSLASANGLSRDGAWSNSLAVGSSVFVEDVKSKLGIRASHRSIVQYGSAALLEEPRPPYRA